MAEPGIVAIDDADAPQPLHDSAATRALEAAALAAGAPHALMARAGLACARLALALWPHARRIHVLAGPGNNGGDGLIAALHLQRLGREVEVLHLADPARLPADAADALRQAHAAGLRLHSGWPTMPPLNEADLLIDGLLGLGATRTPQGAIAHAIAAANASGRPLLAIDLPSGLHADTGARLGTQAIRADATLGLLTLKPGLFTAEGRDHAGAVWLDRLGCDPAADAACGPSDTACGPIATACGRIDGACAWLGSRGHAPPPGFAPRRHAQHKGSFGDVFVVGGAAGMQGAAQLAAGAALAAGAGRVYLSLLGPLTTGARPELMQHADVWHAGAERLRAATVVCGCGGGTAVAATLPPLLAHAGRLLLDADALNAIAADAALLMALRARGERGAPALLTPHPLEAARLLACSTAAVQADRLAAARALAERCQAVVVLKGSGSVIAAPGWLPWINASGNAALATPGSGDVLAGWIGGLWAQQPDTGSDTAGFAARAATWLHGHAADRQSQGDRVLLPLRAADLVEAMRAALAESRPAATPGGF
jgi:hydroxyethylthiazole kinase-like uncharacterized protein yjeF